MAFAQKHGDRFRVVFHFGGRKYRKGLKTDKEDVAEAIVGGVKRTLMMLEQGLLQMPDGADVLSFILSGGQEAKVPEQKVKTEEREAPATLQQLRDQYTETMGIGAIEKNSLDTVTMHLRHIIKTLGARFVLPDLTLGHLQQHVNRRAKAKGLHGKRLSPTTIRKEIASFRATWNWGVQMGLVKGSYPNKGLKFPKLDEKPPFQTWDEIERQIERGGLVNGSVQELWDCLYLRKTEIDALLAYVKLHATLPWVYPLVCTAAHTGTRRSELVRIDIGDIDFERRSLLIREKKRSKEKRTTRRVTITPFLKGVLEAWLAVHPGGQWLFAQNAKVVRSKSKRTAATQLTRNEVHDHFKRTLSGGKWKVVRGLHCLRHSFISCLAAAGVDQRIIDELAGHQTPEQQKRYRHLGPDVKQEAVARVFG